MKKKYTQSQLNEFFEEFKKLPNSYKIEQVHQLINNPNAKAMHRVNTQFKHLKTIIMTSAFIIGVASIMLWLNPNESKVKSEVSLPVIPHEEISANIVEKVVANADTNPETIFEKSKPYKKSNEITQAVNSSPKETNQESFEIQEEDNCFWPEDTVINKKSLYVYLSVSELKNLGVSLEKDSMYYSNTTPDKRYGGTTSTNWHTNKPPKTNFNFHMVYSTDTACTRYRWGHKFYAEVDTLVPVVIGIHEDYDKILWFTATPSFFDALPTRYKNLESVFKQLICLKKKNPNHQFVNHWKIENNIVLDEINFLELSVDNLEKLSFQFFEDSLSLVHPTKSMFYNMGKWMSNTGTKCIDSVSFPPNPLPVIVTDEKGLEQNFYGHGNKTDFDKTMFDILVPVKIPLNELISTKDYYLIFWFYPTNEFIAALPERIRKDLKSEIEIITNPNSENKSSCTYFEVCKSTLNLKDFVIFPNPAKYSVTIEFDSMDELEGSISLVNISGSQLRTLVPKTSFMSGKNSYQVDLSGITPGIYLVSISTNKGFRTQRLIISQ